MGRSGPRIRVKPSGGANEFSTIEERETRKNARPRRRESKTAQPFRVPSAFFRVSRSSASRVLPRLAFFKHALVFLRRQPTLAGHRMTPAIPIEQFSTFATNLDHPECLA